MTVLYPNSSYNDVCYKAGPFHCNIGVSWPGPYIRVIDRSVVVKCSGPVIKII